MADYTTLTGVPAQTAGSSPILASHWNDYVKDNFNQLRRGHLADTSNPSGVDEGTMYYNSSTHKLMIYGGSTVGWVELFTLLSSAGTYPLVTPPGVIAPYAAASAPSGWRLCDGATYDSTTNTQYAALYGVIGNLYGGINGANFRVPDLRGRSIIGYGQGTGQGIAGTKEQSLSYATTGATGNGTTATVSIAAGHPFVVGSTIVVSGVTPSGYNGTYTVTALSGTTGVSYANATVAAYSGAGTVAAPTLTNRNTLGAWFGDERTANHTHNMYHTHTYSGTTGDDSPDHAHYFNDTYTVFSSAGPQLGTGTTYSRFTFSYSDQGDYTAGSNTRHQHGYSGTTSPSQTNTDSGATTGGNQANLMPSLVLNYIIKY
jgi:microcystin-dependent protein